MKIVPYTSVDSLLFGISTRNDCIALYGPPQEIYVVDSGNEELWYKKWIIRFGATSQTLCECTLLPGAKGTVGGINLTWDRNFLRNACICDGNPIESLGFIILKRFGIAVTGIHDDDRAQLAVTAFSKGDFDMESDYDVPFDYHSL